MDKDYIHNQAMYEITGEQICKMQEAIDSLKWTTKRNGITVERVELRDNLTGKTVRAGRKYGHRG